MLSFLSDRRVLSVSAALITAAIFLFLLGTYPSWRGAIKDGVSWSHSSAPPVISTGDQSARESSQPTAARPQTSSTATQTPASPVAPPLPPRSQPAPAAKPSSPAAPPAGTTSDAAEDKVAPENGGTAATPSFDVVRVEPSGDSVVAARAKPGASVVLLDQGRPIARAQADASGQVAFVPPALAPGEHSLMLSADEANAPAALSSQSVAVSVSPTPTTAPMVALIQPDKPTRVLSDGAAPAAGKPAAPSPPVAVAAIDVEEQGGVYATGKAAPNSHCRVYLNGAFVAPVTAGPDGTWSLKIQHGMKPGHYAVRVDQLGSADGNVSARAEVPFDYPANQDRSASLLRPSVSRPGGRSAGSSGAAMPPTSATSAAARLTSPAAPGASTSTPDLAAAMPQQPAQPLVASAATTDSATLPDSQGVSGNEPTVVAQLLTTKVMHGDSLWRISRKMLGHGRRYTQIYATNTAQIRDPALIYPGQIFVMPQTQTP